MRLFGVITVNVQVSQNEFPFMMVENISIEGKSMSTLSLLLNLNGREMGSEIQDI